MATITFQNNEYDIPDNILSQYLKYDRMQVLRGEWIPPVGISFYTIRPHHIGNIGYNNLKDGTTWVENSYYCLADAHARGIRFFPTRELAEEYLLIAEGKWLPKKGDTYCAINRKRADDLCDNCVSRGHDVSALEHYIYFPSEAQRDEYIAKHKKPERPLVGSVIDLTAPDGTVYKATLQ